MLVTTFQSIVHTIVYFSVFSVYLIVQMSFFSSNCNDIFNYGTVGIDVQRILEGS